MSSQPGLDALVSIQAEIQSFLEGHEMPAISEVDFGTLDLSHSEWRLSIAYGKLIFEAWNASRSFHRRIECISYRDRGRLGVVVRKPGGRETVILEFHDAASTLPDRDEAARRDLRRQVETALRREFPDWVFSRFSNRTDREHSFSSWYVRGYAKRGRTAWAVLALGDSLNPTAVDAVLAHGLNWLGWLRENHPELIFSGIKILLPPDAVNLTAHRAVFINSSLAKVSILARRSPAEPLREVDLQDFGNVETHLVPRLHVESVLARHRDFLAAILGEEARLIDLSPGAALSSTSIRYLGLTLGRIEGHVAPRIYFGLDGQEWEADETCGEEFRRFVRQIVEARAARTGDLSSPAYALHPERWLETLLIRDLTKIDPALLPQPVYQQVPAFTGADRGVVDILGVTVSGRLAVLELKLDEQINLPLQGLDYWLRVKWLNERGQFRERGYFPGIELSQQPPLIYLVSPAFRFHTSNETVLRFFDPSIQVVRVGLNQQWRDGIKVLFRRNMSARAEASS
ncbi:MAG: hypothetical protein ACRD3T_04675 [Terriglobia bacterium]